jgi:hypothetical protein
MKLQNLTSYFFKLLQPKRIFILLLLVLGIYLLPLGSKPEFVEHNGQIISVSQPSPILQSVYPEGIYATCGQGGTGTNCHTGCCSAGACVVCPPREEENRPPSISANLNCSNPGNNGWCIGTLTLNLNASDPQGAGLLITGTLNGNNFACPSGATACSIPVTQETSTGAITYRVNASTGLAAAGSASYKLDATTPILNGSLNGVAGTNSWYRSNVTLNVTSSDSLSGLAATTASINGGAATAVTGPLSFSDGISTVVVTATDNAGNSTQTTQTIQVDTITPSLSTALSGTSGANGWYVSTVTITPSASDSGSGLAALEATVDNGAWSIVNGPLSFTDGIHTYQFRATDTAGNVTQTVEQTVKVDTTTPSISLNISGTNGKNGWYVSDVTVTPILSDSTAGIAALEAAVDNGVWTIVNGPLSFTDGLHSYQFKVTDQAGNSTTIPIQNLKIDTIAPFIDMTAALSLGETVYYALEDYGSGLELYRAVIEDDDERYQKIVWLDLLDGNKLVDQIRWDGKFKDGTPAGNGEYFITLKISDEAGNETMQTAVVSVNFLSFLQDIPAFTVPESTTSLEAQQAAQADNPSASEFGGENNNTPESQETFTTNEGGNGIVWPEGTMGEVEFSIESTTTTNSFPLDPNILWGVAATALAGATLAEWERQREEERRRAEEAQLEKRKNTEKRRDQKKAEDAVRERWAAEAEAKTGGGKGLNSPVQVVKPMPAGLSPEAQAAFLHGGAAATSWIGSNTSTLQAQYVVDLAKQKEREKEKALEDFRAGERDSSAGIPLKEENWWEKTKSFVAEKIIQPVNSSVFLSNVKSETDKVKAAITSSIATVNENFYQPYIKPQIEREIAKVTSAIATVNEKVYQPYIKPQIEREIARVTSAIATVNENFYQPYIKPQIEREIAKVTSAIATVNENFYQPFIKPQIEREIAKVTSAIATVNENFYQPFIKPIVDPIVKLAEDGAAWVDKNIYQPVFAPVVNDINQYIYQPVANAAKEAWATYGEWVHGGLDAAGLIPGFGEIADGLNGLIYLGEGRYVEAGVSALAMIPILGDLGKAGKWTITLGSEVVEVVVETAVKTTVKEIAEEAAEEAVEKIVKNTAELILEKPTREALENAAQKAAENALEKGAKEAARPAIVNAAQEAGEHIEADTVRNVVRKSINEFLEGDANKIAKEAAEARTQRLVDRLVTYPPGSPLRLTPEEFLNNKASQQALYDMATKMRDEQAALAKELLEKLNIKGEFNSILKRDSLDEFVEGLVRKSERNNYAIVGEIDDMSRGRFNLESWDDVDAVKDAVQKQDDFKIINEEPPRREQPGGGFGYPRFHEVLQDPETLITHEWQIGTKATTDLFETSGIDTGTLKLKPGMHNDLHDIEYDIFKAIQNNLPETAEKYGIPDFRTQLDQFAGQTGKLGDQTPNLPETITQFHTQASEILKKLLDEQGTEFIEKYYH